MGSVASRQFDHASRLARYPGQGCCWPSSSGQRWRPSANRKFKRPFRRVWRVCGGRASAGWGSDRRSALGISAARGPAAVQSGAISCRFPAASRAQASGLVAASERVGISPSALRLFDCVQDGLCGRWAVTRPQRAGRLLGPVVRLLQHAVLLEVAEDGADRVLVLRR